MAQVDPVRPATAAEEPVTTPTAKQVAFPEKTEKVSPGETNTASLDSPKVKNVDNGLTDTAQSRSAPHSPAVSKAGSVPSADEKSPPKDRNVKAEAFAVAHKDRVEAEVRAWMESQIRKSEAHSQLMQVSAAHEAGLAAVFRSQTKRLGLTEVVARGLSSINFTVHGGTDSFLN